jgi:methylenetetrahydrofolate reductase (NADPH)
VKNFSFEFFPPNTEVGAQKLSQVHADLAALGPEFFSVTFGAGGATREKTLSTVAALLATGSEVAPHVSCIGSTGESIKQLIDGYLALGVKRVVALRGDMPSGMGFGSAGEFRFANELVAFVRKHYGNKLHIEVAAYPESHPQSKSASADLNAFVEKVRAGADSAITQYFFNSDAYLHFRDQVQAKGVKVPIVPGIMPITNYVQLARFSDACGAEIPRWIRQRLSDFGDDLDSIKAFGHDTVLRLCEVLIKEGAPSLHFYTLNQAAPTSALVRDIRPLIG